MIKKYTYGIPFDTEAVVQSINTQTDEMPFFDIKREHSHITFLYNMTDSTIVYGLGQQVRGINKRGWQYISWNYDNPHHQEDTRSLYGAHNFMIIKDGNLFGIFFDYPGKLIFDIGYTSKNEMTIYSDNADMNVYIITGNSEKQIVNEFRKLIGKSYIPPLWAFGYGQSRWGYKDEEDIRTVAGKYRKLGTPLDSIYMDIDYMEDYKDFTVNSQRFSDLKKLSADMKEDGIHLVPIIDAGIKIEEGYDIYEEGVENNYFCKNEEGNDFTGAVWPGRVHFPDFLNPDAREWFGSKYEKLTSLGIDGFWNDMNEPAIFYTEEKLHNTLEQIDLLKNENIGLRQFFNLTGMVAGLNGNNEYYDKFYHCVNGKMIKHSLVHNLYGMNMTRSANESLCKINPDKRTLFFSRSSYIGAHRYGGIWQGDNKSWWSHILLSMQQLPALNMCGFLFIGADVGGFGCDVTEDLMMRWLQYSLFTPLFRNHSADGTRRQELYEFSIAKELTEMIRIRYSLIPYLYSEFLKAAENDEMMFRPLAFDFNQDKQALSVEDQLLIGNEIMIAPVYQQNATGRYVYLPEEMMMITMKSYEDYKIETLEKGHHYIKSELNELVFFIRKDQTVPMFEPSTSTAKTDYEKYRLIGYNGASYNLLHDDGISSYVKPEVRILINQ